jgi:hypothetical protein
MLTTASCATALSRNVARPACVRPRALAARRRVDVAQQPRVHRQIPLAPIVAERRRVPPVAVELAVAKAQQLGEQIEIVVKEDQEEEQPHVEVRHRELEHAFGEPTKRERAQRLLGAAHRRREVLLGDEGGERKEKEHLRCAARDKRPANRGRARIVELVAERWREQEVAEVLQCQVVGIGDGRLDALDLLDDFAVRLRLNSANVAIDEVIGEHLHAEHKRERHGGGGKVRPRLCGENERRRRNENQTNGKLLKARIGRL